jgi:parvulin-like peptidyl-prolyl isomerase
MRVLPKIHLFLPALVLSGVVAGCGGGGGGGSARLSPSDVAIVAGKHVSKAAFDDGLRQQKLSLQAQGQKFPNAGTPEYASIRSQVLAALVQAAEFEQEAQKLGVSPTDQDVNKQLEAIKKQYFGGSDQRYLKSLKQQGYTDAQVREQIRSQLIAQRLFDKVTGDVRATDQDVHAYYVSHKSEYPPTRQVQEILVGKGKEDLARQIYEQLKKGANFAALAKKYSKDPGSKNAGGVYTASKGKDVPEFDKAVFSSAKKGTLLPPVNTAQYGWFVIKLLGDVKPTSEREVAATISGQLVQQKRNQQMTDWVTRISKSYCKGGKIKYQPGYQPVPDPCEALLAPPATTAG